MHLFLSGTRGLVLLLLRDHFVEHVVGKTVWAVLETIGLRTLGGAGSLELSVFGKEEGRSDLMSFRASSADFLSIVEVRVSNTR